MTTTAGETIEAAQPQQLGCAFEPQRYYRPTEIEAMTGLTSGALSVMRSRGDGPEFTKIGRRVLYKGANMIAYLDAGTARNTAEAAAKRRAG